MRLSVTHTTRYIFSDPVVHALQRIRMTPKITQGQEIIRWDVEVDNAQVELEYEDQHCNHVTLVSAVPGTREVVVRCSGEVETTETVVPEGVEGRVPYKGPAQKILYQLIGGLRSAMGYCASHTIGEPQTGQKERVTSPLTKVAGFSPENVAACVANITRG